MASALMRRGDIRREWGLTEKQTRAVVVTLRPVSLKGRTRRLYRRDEVVGLIGERRDECSGG
jgi:hypothetical protein